VCLTVKPVGQPDAGDRPARERGWETGRCRMAQVTAPILDSTANRTYHGHRKVDANDPKYDIGVLIGNTLRRSPVTGSSLQPAV
jgi:hypothetical protein